MQGKLVGIRRDAPEDFNFAGDVAGAVERHDVGHGSSAGGKARGGGEQTVRPKDRSGATTHNLQQLPLHIGTGFLFVAVTIF